MVVFYLSRDTLIRDGAYTLTTYLPKAPPSGQAGAADSWWFWGDDHDITMQVSAEIAHKIEAKIGRPLNHGEAVNLTTGESVMIVDAPRLKSV